MKSKLLDLFFPKICPLCKEVIPFGEKYCGCSGRGITRISDAFCAHCGHDKNQCCCSGTNTEPLRHIAAPFVYSGEIRARILMFKYANEKREAEFFGSEMALRFAACFPNVKPDVVTFVPMTKTEKEERGYNQSELLAKSVAKALFTKCAPLLEKIMESERQHTLSGAERYENLKNTFAAADESKIEGRIILLCDDIKTTGTTLKRCFDVLCASKAKDVYCLTAAVSDYVSDKNEIFEPLTK